MLEAVKEEMKEAYYQDAKPLCVPLMVGHYLVETSQPALQSFLTFDAHLTCPTSDQLVKIHFASLEPTGTTHSAGSVYVPWSYDRMITCLYDLFPFLDLAKRIDQKVPSQP